MEELSKLNETILQRRAEELARPVEETSANSDTVSLLKFSLMGSRYALDLGSVSLVTRIGEIFSIPLAPRHISGIIRRRGDSIALVSLKHFFNPQTEGIFDSDFAIIVSALNKRFALQVQEIIGVSVLDRSDLMPPPDNFDSTQLPYVKGVTEEGMIVINLDALVQAPGFSTSGIAV